MKTIFLILGSMVSRGILSGLLHNTAQPLARNMVRNSIKLAIRVIATGLIGALTFAAGIIVSFIDLGQQMTEGGGIYFSPNIGFGLGMVLVGAIFIYIAGFTNLFSPWKKLEKRDREHKGAEEGTFSHLAETLIAAIQDRSDLREEKMRRTYRDRFRSENRNVPPSAHSQTDRQNYNDPLH